MSYQDWISPRILEISPSTRFFKVSNLSSRVDPADSAWKNFERRTGERNLSGEDFTRVIRCLGTFMTSFSSDKNAGFKSFLRIDEGFSGEALRCFGLPN
jgi:hypothetical protein